MKIGAIVLCGGESSRMGYPKALLPFGEETMLTRVVRLTGGAVALENVVVVAAEGQELPGLPAAVEVVRDERQGRGPLEGLAAGLRSLAGRIDAAYATSCDVPQLHPAFVQRMFALLGEHDIAVPCDEEHYHPLAAVYRIVVLKHAEQLLAEDRRRPFFLFEIANTRVVDTSELRAVDPQLATLRNINTPREYFAALEATGLSVPPHLATLLTSRGR